MSDIARRLRAEADKRRSGNRFDSLEYEAADEIHRLRELVQDLIAAISAAGYVIVPREPTEAQAKAAAAEVPTANLSVFGWMAGYRAMLAAGGHDDD